METKSRTNPPCTQINPQPISEFRLRPRYRNGRATECRTCHNSRQQAWRRANSERAKATGRRQYARDPGKACKKSRGCRFRQKYWPDLTYKQALAEWDRMFLAQKGLCAVCQRARPLEVEHDHKTGRVRSLACGGCNTAIARVEENFDIALGVAKYIQEHKNVV